MKNKKILMLSGLIFFSSISFSVENDKFLKSEINDDIFLKFVGEDYPEDNSDKNYYIVGENDEKTYIVEGDKYSILSKNIDELNVDYIISSKNFSLDTDDSLEFFNRRMYAFNTQVDKKILFPATLIYKRVVPKPLREGVNNFYSNFKEVPTFVNSILQFKGDKALNALGRFAINSTLGIGGINDIATKFGLKKDYETMGETMGVYGIGTGSYLILPVLGPSSIRDGIGAGIDGIMEHKVRANILEKPLLFRKGVDEFTYGSTRVTATGLSASSYVNFRYGDFNSPFEYDLVKIFYSNFMKIKVKK